MKKNSLTSKQIKELLPEDYQAIAFQTFTIPSGHRAYVRVRTRNLDTKPALYLFDTDTNSFISSLYFDPETKRFIFDYQDKSGNRQFASVDPESLTCQAEERGYYKSDPSVFQKLLGAVA
ncbi:MAG: hypothetical protein ABSG94_12330 [Brevinematales bacterium]|jgi:hypothetical protein